jgi:hypothetical protein
LNFAKNFSSHSNFMTAPALVQKLWNYCNILRDDGLSYGDYVEQLTFLLFLKMADEQSRPPFNKPSPIPKGFDWPALLNTDTTSKRFPLTSPPTSPAPLASAQAFCSAFFI